MMQPPTTRDDGALTDLPPGSRVREGTPPRHNGAVSLSLVCALLWPIAFFVPILIMRASGVPTYPDWVGALTGPCLITSPFVGIIAGGVGLYRSFKHSTLRASRWLALAGLLCNLLWLAGIRLL